MLLLLPGCGLYDAAAGADCLLLLLASSTELGQVWPLQGWCCCLAVAFLELVLLPGCGIYRAGAVAWLWPLQSWCCCFAVAFIELVLLPGCGLYRAGAVAWLWPL
jgi:hypothetical protein